MRNPICPNKKARYPMPQASKTDGRTDAASTRTGADGLNRAKLYQLVLFPFNNGATNVYYVLLMNYIAYYAEGVLGLLLAFATTMVTVTRALDAFIDATRDVKIYLTETSADEFYRNDDNRIYRYFDLNWAEPLFEGQLCPEVMLYAYCIGEPINISLQKPYYYSGESSLVLTVIAENGEECTNGGFYVNFFTIPDTKKHALPFASDFITFQSVLFGDRWCEGAHISPIESPVVQIAYEDSRSPCGEAMCPPRTWTST